MKKLPLLALLMLPLAFTACFNDSVVEPPPFTPTPADTARDVFANQSATAVNNALNVYAGLTAPVADTIRNVHADTVNAASNPYAYVDLDKDSVLPATGDTSAWDLAFRSTGVRVRGEFLLLSSTSFDNVLEAPKTGLTIGTPAAWYDYNTSTNVITPKAGTILLVKTSSGNYAKIEFLSYYKNAPANPTSADTARYYTFRYAIQKDGNPSLRVGVVPRTYFSLRANAVVTDTSAGWDLGFSKTGILVNGSSQLVASNFDSLKTAPETGYAAGAAAAWYDYAGEPTHLISPKANMTLALKLADGKYAKLTIASYYKGAPAAPNGLLDTSAYYTFRYVLQANGSRDLSPSAGFTYYSLRADSAVADSNAQWDIAFSTTSVKVNGQAQWLTTSFDTLSTAPAAGYTSGVSAWYSYNPDTHIVSPLLGQVLVIKTTDNKFAKVEFLSYYQGFPAIPNEASVPRYYTFRYVFQADGSANIK